MHLIDVLDNSGNPNGDVKNGLEVHSQGLWHASSHIWIYNSKGEILLQLRSKIKNSFPGLWDISAAGHVDAGEDPLTAAARELDEEIGIKIKNSELKHIDTRKVEYTSEDGKFINNEFDYVYLYKYEGTVDELVLQTEEVDDMRFIPLEQFRKEINNTADYKKYVPHGDYYQFVANAIEKELSK